MSLCLVLVVLLSALAHVKLWLGVSIGPILNIRIGSLFSRVDLICLLVSADIFLNLPLMSMQSPIEVSGAMFILKHSVALVAKSG